MPGEVIFILRKLFFCGALIFFFAGRFCAAEAAGGLVEGVEVSVWSDGAGYAIPAQIEKRMRASVVTIAEHVLLGRAVDEISAGRQGYEHLIREVFDRILLGYTVRSVEIEAGATAKIQVDVTAWQDIIREVEVRVVAEELSPEIAALAEADAAGVSKVFEQILLGLPLDAVDWTGGIVKASMREYLAERLPEFRADFEIETGASAKVKVSLYPKGAVVRDVKLSMRSDSAPNLLLFNYRSAILRQARALVGVPVGFVERHKAYFTAAFAQRLDADRTLQALGVKTKAELYAGETAEIEIHADTNKYNIFVEGYLDVGREEDNTSFRLHAGKYISPRDELYVETDFVPHKVKWVFAPGLSRMITPQTTAGFKYDLDRNVSILWAKQRAGDRWTFRFEHTPSIEFNEFAARYKMDDFVGLEYVMNDDDRWLRVVGNF